MKPHQILVLLSALFALGGCASSFGDAQGAHSTPPRLAAPAQDQSLSGQKETQLYFDLIAALIKQQRCGAA